MTMTYYQTPESPLAEALEIITGKHPSELIGLKGIYYCSQLNDDELVALELWCQENRPKWTPGYGVLEAAELLVKTAVENANI